MAVHHLFRRPQKEPIKSFYVGHPGNDEEQNRIWRKKARFQLLGSVAKISVLFQIIFCASSFTGRPSWIALIGASRSLCRSLCSDIFTSRYDCSHRNSPAFTFLQDAYAIIQYQCDVERLSSECAHKMVWLGEPMTRKHRAIKNVILTDPSEIDSCCFLFSLCSLLR